MQNERKRIQEDVVLSKGERKIVLPTKGGNQEVLTIELDFLPLWLAKINANVTDNPEIQERLVNYQLHAKDVLANVFIDNKIIPLSKDQALVTLLRTSADLVEGQQEIRQEQQLLKQRIDEVDQKVEEQITLTSNEQRKLQKVVAKRVYELADKPEIRKLADEDDATKIRSKLFRELYRGIKDCFAVPSYKDIRRCDLNEASSFIVSWRPRLVV